MPINTARLKTFAQNTRAKLVSLITTKLHYLLTADNAELRGWENEIKRLRQEIDRRGETNVVEEVAYTWFNRVMALRYMDAKEFNSPMIVTPGEGQTRPQILEDAMAGIFDDSLKLTPEVKLLEGAALYRRLLIAVCQKNYETMPFLFEHLSDYTELLLPDDLLSEQSFVTDIRKGMSVEDCQNVEIMGWLYQFYITDRKNEAERNKWRRGGLNSEEQAAATQLFTPHWIVRYMVENSLGRIWMALHPESRLIEEMPYYIAQVEGQIDAIPNDIKSASDIRFLDPCMGSGHILVYAFDLFAKMYEEEGKEKKEIPTLILQNNLFGIDIDPRCYQLASFALTMKARDYYRRYLRNPVGPNVIALQSIDHETIASTGSWPAKSLVWQMEHLDTIGSLLKITPEESNAISVEEGIFGTQQKLMKTQAEYLSRSYHCVVTNPPYLGKGKGDSLKSYIEIQYPNTKGDCMATFMERSIDFCAHGGKIGMINQDSWMFTVTYEDFRTNLLSSDIHIDSLIHLGPHAFAEIGGEKVKSATFVLGKHLSDVKGLYISVFDTRNSIEKEKLAKEAITNHDCNWAFIVSQNSFHSIDGQPISFWGTEAIYETFSRNRPLSAVCKPTQWLATADNGRFLRSWFEVAYRKIGIGCKSIAASVASGKKFFPYNKGGSPRRWYGNQELVINWENDGSEIRSYKGAVIRNPSFYFKECISWGLISGPKFRYFPEGFLFDVQGMSCFYEDKEQLNREIAWQNTKVFNQVSKIISPAGHIQIGEIAKMPCCDNSPDGIERIGEDCIAISKKDWDAHETSWDFQTNELVRIGMEKDLDSLHSILAYYKREWEEKFFQLHDNEEELNRRFIGIYGLQDELTPDVPLEEVTILQKEEKNIVDGELVWNDSAIIKQFLSYLVGCFMGRYSIERPGLVIANQGQHPEDLDFVPKVIPIDDDGIIPIIEEADFFADDMTQRVEAAVESLYGKEKKEDNLRVIRNAIGMDLRKYFFDKFYADHLSTYSVKGAKRPIYWLFTSKMGDKRKKGYFKALVYMHRMEEDTLSKLHADYALPYLQKLQRQLNEVESELSRDDLSNRKAMVTMSDNLRAKIREVREFVDELAKMASHRQTIDLDDGVAVNYPKFYPLLEPVKFPKPSDEE